MQTPSIPTSQKPLFKSRPATATLRSSTSCRRSPKPRLIPEIQIGALRLLATFENPQLAQRALEYAVSGKVRNQDAAIQLAISLEIEKNRDLAWMFIQTHWNDVKKEFTPEMGTVLVGATAAFCSESARDDVSQFFSTHKVPDADQELKHAIERINGCIELRNLQEPQLKSWLASQPKSATSETAH